MEKSNPGRRNSKDKGWGWTNDAIFEAREGARVEHWEGGDQVREEAGAAGIGCLGALRAWLRR